MNLVVRDHPLERATDKTACSSLAGRQGDDIPSERRVTDHCFGIGLLPIWLVAGNLEFRGMMLSCPKPQDFSLFGCGCLAGKFADEAACLSMTNDS